MMLMLLTGRVLGRSALSGYAALFLGTRMNIGFLARSSSCAGTPLLEPSVYIMDMLRRK